jgi:hypothetical protein
MQLIYSFGLITSNPDFLKKTLRHYFFVIVFLLFFGASPFAQTAPDRDDNQIWHETVLGVPLTSKFTLSFNLVPRFSVDQKIFTDARAGAGLSFKANKNVTLGSAYLYRFTETTGNRKNYENRIIAYLTLAKNFGKYNFSDRNQYEYQARNSRGDKWVYRNRLQIEREAKINNFAFKPFASAEVFYDSLAEKFSRLRVVGGAGKKLNKLLTLDVYYLRQQDATTRPGDLNVFGTTLRVNFDVFEINK